MKSRVPKFGRVRITVTSLSSHLVADKLAQAGVQVYWMRRLAKNVVAVEVAGKDCEKVFAILRGSCYNVVKVRERGLALLYKKCFARVGLLAGALLFALIVVGAQHRILRIEVVGSGAYYEREVLSALSAGGVKKFAAIPRNFTPFTAEILALPRVNYCEMKCSGGILTVDVRVSDEHAALTAEPLLAPRSGRVEELTVLRGTACVTVGEEVQAGQTLVASFVLLGEEKRASVVIAQVRISYPVRAEYAGTEEEALAQAFLDYGELKELQLQRTQQGYCVTGRAEITSAINLE